MQRYKKGQGIGGKFSYPLTCLVLVTQLLHLFKPRREACLVVDISVGIYLLSTLPVFGEVIGAMIVHPINRDTTLEQPVDSVF